MKYSSLLLQRFFTHHHDIDDLMRRVTDHIFEIEEYKTFIAPDVVVGYVTHVVRHPNADSLMVCQIDCGGSVYQICTGATNICADIYVPVALPGCYLPALGFTIQSKKMRGEESCGMICSVEELGIDAKLGVDHGIWILSGCSKTDCGKLLGEVYPWLEHHTYEVKGIAIANRSDLMGHRGAALELKTLLRNEIYRTTLPGYLETFAHTHIGDLVRHSAAGPSVSVQTQLCRTYIAMSLDLTSLKESFYMKYVLASIGQGSVGTLVDWSNIFMETRGQPIHCFDRQKIQGMIIIDMARTGEEFVDLTGKTHILSDQDIVIRDELGVIAVAGVIGGLRTAISSDAREIVLEIANFDPVYVRRTSMRVARTDASIKYEKNINPTRTAQLVPVLLDELKYSGIEYMLHGITRHYTPDPAIRIRRDDAAIYYRIYNTHTSDYQIICDILTHLGYGIDDEYITVPTWRVDIHHIDDITEDIVRHIGLETIQPLLSPPTSPKPYSKRISRVRDFEQILVERYAFDQTETYSRSDAASFDHHGTIRLVNPLDVQDDMLRSAIYPNLINIYHKNKRIDPIIHIFDHGKVFAETESYHCSFLTVDDFLQAKNIVSDLIGNYTLVQTSRLGFHPTLQADIVQDGAIVGYIAAIHPAIASCVICEYDIDMIVDSPISEKYLTLSDQIVTRDITIHLNGTSEMIHFEHPMLMRYEQSDIYRLQDSISITYRMYLMGDGSTSAPQFNDIIDSLISQLPAHAKIG